MSVYGGISGSSGQVLVLSIWDVNVVAIVAVLLGQPEVDNVDQIALLAQTHKEVIRFDIAVNKISSVNELDSTNLLIITNRGKQKAQIC